MLVHLEERAGAETGARALSERRLPPRAQRSKVGLQQSMRDIYVYIWCVDGSKSF
ncbi:predicted protein [Plenodomus lingam JN3]|uniref:Predicted protein n=1 Tax=Leptosphaeria maculans (strain JN3 / isolate v23.1.3 / race Av1-4-5-6-7-8) TaxID=985895 RepID=E4ZVL5_LEPMJ|nr:predicted protein [Plenodomus lingam JN3]CBX95641.1 predicted protein [Plenodomus lingam JN3]